jgi:hypothetical protein
MVALTKSLIQEVFCKHLGDMGLAKFEQMFFRQVGDVGIICVLQTIYCILFIHTSFECPYGICLYSGIDEYLFVLEE